MVVENVGDLDVVFGNGDFTIVQDFDETEEYRLPRQLIEEKVSEGSKRGLFGAAYRYVEHEHVVDN